MRKRVLIVSNSWEHLFPSRTPLIEHLTDTGWEVHVAAPGPRPGQLRAPAIAADRFHAFPLERKSLGPWGFLRTTVALHRLVKRTQPDVAHFITLKTLTAGALATAGGRHRVVLQFTGLGSLFLEPRLAYRWIRKALARVLSRMAADGRTHFIFQNPEDRDLLLTEGLKTPYGRLHLIEGNGIEARPPLERAVGGPDSVILLPARLLRQKGIFDFAAAITLLRAEGHSVRGVLAGGLDPQNPSALTESEIRGLAAQGTEWVGHQEDLRQWFASATAVCLPSAGEGLPRVLLEAAVDETPLIATRVPGCTSVVKDGVTGFLCEFGSPTDLARAIRQVLVDPTRARELGRAARQHVLTRFGKERILSEIVHVYTR